MMQLGSRSGWLGLLGLSVLLALGSSGPAEAQQQTPQKYGVMPRVLPAEFTAQGARLFREWRQEALPHANDRLELYRRFVAGLVDYREFQNRVAEIYPKNQLEWLLITDEVADSLVANWVPVLDAYQDQNPQEVLTQGRQLFELALMRITGPPSRMLGFHTLMLAEFASTKADSLAEVGATRDMDGLADGVLRATRDWAQLWGQVHRDALSSYESRITQEDWVVARLEDNCGRSRWRVTQQYMALVGTDSTKTPPEDRYAHEFHLSAEGCDDKRIILVDLPHFNAMQLQVLETWERSGQ